MWESLDPRILDRELILWENGVRSVLTSWGNNPAINDRGDVYFLRNHAGIGWQAHLFLNGQFRQLTDDPFWNTDGQINNKGEVAWRFGPTSSSDIRFLRRFDLGDLNCDGAFNGADVEPFFAALGSPAAYKAAFPTCDVKLADMNADGAVNGADIDAFFAALGGG